MTSEGEAVYLVDDRKVRWRLLDKSNKAFFQIDHHGRVPISCRIPKTLESTEKERYRAGVGDDNGECRSRPVRTIEASAQSEGLHGIAAGVWGVRLQQTEDR